MDPSGGHVVLEISSDEEGLVSDVTKGSGSEGYDWLEELLGDGVDDLVPCDSDEVVMVKEVNAKSMSNKLVTDDDDDDCVVLDGDPEKSVSALDDAVDGGSDDLLIVGETGQVACRDYPHPRHDCATFPFSSTSHEKHCNLCHCYVCDSPAPCAYWVKGLTNVDHHCHANDKGEKWKVFRKNFMQGKSTPMPVLSFPPDLVSTVLAQPSQALPSIKTQLPTNSTQNLVSRPMIFQPCSSPTRSSFSSTIQNGRRPPYPGHVFRSTFPPLSSSEQLHRPHRVIQKDRGHRDSYLGSQHASPVMSHKRTGTVGSSLAVSRAACGPNINYPPYLLSSSNSIHNTIVNRNHIRRQNIPSSLNLVSSTHLSNCSPNLIGVSSSMTTSQAGSGGQGTNQSLSGQNMHQHHSQPSTFPNFSDSWINELPAAEDEPPAPPAFASIHVPSTEPAHEAESAREFNTAVAGSFDMENWWFENPPLENNFPPVPAAVDASMLLFDFETWNSVTQI